MAVRASEIPLDFLVQARDRAMVDPVWFAEEILQLKSLPGEHDLNSDPNDTWELDGWTKDLLNAAGDVVRKQEGVPTVINHEGINQISVRAMHGPGKTFGLACLIHWFNFCFPGKVPCTAPKLGQLKTRLWPEFGKIRNRAVPLYKNLMRVRGTKISWLAPPDAEETWSDIHTAFMETASAPENLAGLHHKYMMVCVDEASGVDETLWPVIEGAISVGKVIILVIISNPTKNSGTFADTHLKPIVSKDWFKIHIRLQDTKRVSRAWVKRMENKYGAKSPVVKVRCHGEFADDDENQLISLSWLEQSRAEPFEPDGSIPRQRLSIDVADGGSNFSVITHAVHYQSFTYFSKQKEYSFPGGRAVTMVVNEAVRLWNKLGMDKRNGDTIVVDSLGVGAGVCSALADLGYPVVRYLGGAASDNNKLYRNRRVQSYLVARDHFRDEAAVFADDFVKEDEWDDVYGQLCSIRRKVGTERIEDLPTKEEMKNAGIVSPDRADSIAMQYATQAPILTSFNSENVMLGTTMESAGYDGSLS